jgi:hypothetical protein
MAQADSYDTTNPSGLAQQQTERLETLNKLLRLRREARSKIDRLDKTDDYVSRELEVGDDREPDEGSEPSLGSFARMVDQSKSWGVRGAYIVGSDLENDDADREEDDPAEDDLCARSNSI